MKFNECQKEAIYNNYDKNVLVSAAAGSGKTRVLVERIVELLLCENVSITDMVIMTFTNKATSEMKNRIKLRLEEKIRENPDNIKLIKENSLLHNAKISTIDSFCKRLLDENYNVLDDFDPSYRMAENKELSILYDDVLSELLEEKYADKYYNSLLNIFYVKNDSKIKEVLLNGLKFLSSIPFEKEFLKNRIENFELESKTLFDEYKSQCLDDLKNFLMPIKHLDDAIDILSQIEQNSINAKKKSATLDKLLALKNYLMNGFAVKLKDIDCNDLENLDNIIKLINLLDINNLPDIKNLRGDYFGLKDEYEKYVLPIKDIHIVKNTDNILNICKLLFEAKDEYIVNLDEKKILELLLEFYEIVSKEKKRKNVLSISDPQKFALEILKYKANEIASSYKFIFIDEYQDTNMVQEYILSAISNQFHNNNVFMVGDIKQSIYRFRNAEPRIFAEKFSLYKKDDNGGILNVLKTNYRSSDEILKFVNNLFSKMMFLEYGDIDYLNNDMLGEPSIEEKQLINKKLYNEIDKKIEVKVLYADNKEKGVKKIQLEADYVASKIKSMADMGVNYKDIVILLSSIDGKASYFIDALSKAGVPSYADLKKGFYDRLEIKLMIDILNIIDNPLQDIPVASVLMSNIYNVKNDELAYIKLLYDKFIKFGKEDEFRLYDAINYVATTADLDDKYDIDINILKNKLKKFVSDLEILTFKARYMSISDLINYIYENMNVYNIVASMNNGKIRTANLDILYSNAKGYEKSSFVGLFNFLRYVQKIVERKDDDGIAKVYDENENLVRIMTIHSSKGLEFPIVFLADTNKEYNMDELKSEYMYDKNIGVGIDYVNLDKNYSIFGYKKKIISNVIRDKILQEQLRVLYVALTRAKEKLVITGFGSKEMQSFVNENKNIIFKDETEVIDISSEKKQEYIDFIKSNTSFMKLIVRFFPYGKDFCDIECVAVDIDELENLNDYDKDLLKLDVPKSEIKIDIDFNKDLIDTYKYNYLKDIIPKVSVSTLKSDTKKENYMKSAVKEDDNSDEVLRVDGTEIGSAYHRYMQFFDYDKNEYICLNESNDRKNCREYIDFNKIEKFLNSNLGARVKNAFKNKALYREHKFMKLFSQDDINSFNGLNANNNFICTEKNIIVQGIVDAFFIEKDNCGDEYVVVLDYKTDKINKKNIENKEQLKIDLINNYKIQLDVYKKVLEELLMLPVKEKYIYSFALDEAILL